jgi:hypothetical protein
MTTNNLAIAVEYYNNVGAKNVEGFAKFLHSDVEFIGPLASMKGKDAVINATTNFMDAITSLRIKAQFAAGDQTMLVYEIDMPGIATDFPGASLMTFCDGMIVKIQLIYDGSRLLKKKDEIFS